MISCILAIAAFTFYAPSASAESVIENVDADIEPVDSPAEAPQPLLEARSSLESCRRSRPDCTPEVKKLAGALRRAAYARYRESKDPARCGAALDYVREFETLGVPAEPQLVQAAVHCRLELGFQALGQGDLPNARREYESAAAWIPRHEGTRAGFEKRRKTLNHPAAYLEIIGMLERSRPREPLVTHRVLGLVVLRTDAEQITSDGRRKQCSGTVSPDVLPGIVRQQQAAARYYQALSDGALRIEFENRVLDSAVRRFASDTVDAHSLDPAFDFSSVEADYDTTIIYALSPAPCSTHAVGGHSSRPLVPYQLNSARRGIINMHPGYGATTYWSILIHELFHVFAASTGLDGHGYLPDRRHRSPDWKGEGEHDFRKHHFAKMLREIGGPNPRLLQLKIAGRIPARSRAVLDAHRRAASSVPVERRREAFHLASRLYGTFYDQKNPEKTLQIAGEILALNPHLGSGLEFKARALRAMRRHEEALAPLRRYIELYPGISKEMHEYLCRSYGHTKRKAEEAVCWQELRQIYRDPKAEPADTEVQQQDSAEWLRLTSGTGRNSFQQR